MENTNLFEVAVKEKYRWDYKGQITIEDLFDLKVSVLDSIYKELNKKAKDETEESLLSKTTAINVMLKNKIDIVKYIVSLKLEEIEKRENATKTKEQIQLLSAILDKKQSAELEEKSVQEIQEMLNSLKGY